MKYITNVFAVMLMAFSYAHQTSPMIIVYSNSNVDAEIANKITCLVLQGVGLILKGVGSIIETTGSLVSDSLSVQAPYRPLTMEERFKLSYKNEYSENRFNVGLKVWLAIGGLAAGYIAYRLLSSQSDEDSMEE